jgi:dCMP deaminase
MREAKLWAERSKCLSRPIGAVLVQGKNVIATGFNGPASGLPHCDYRDDQGNYTDHSVVDKCPRQRMGFKSGEGMEHCVAIHAEINPIMQAARMGLSTKGATLYAYCGVPCLNCTKEIIQAGIKRVVCLKKEQSGAQYNFPLAEKLYELAGVVVNKLTEEEINE